MTMLKFATILLIQMLSGMEMYLVSPSLPELRRVFNLSHVIVQMTISVNFVVFCIGALFAGALGDRYNRRHIILIGLSFFVLGSLLCIVTPNFFLLIVGRALQGMGISAPAILSFPPLLEDYSTKKQPGIMGMINGINMLAIAIAPVIGSFVNLYFSWRGNFSLLLGLGLLCLIMSYVSIPNKMRNDSVSLSLKTYLPLLKSQKILMFSLGISLMTAAYWLFFGMAPIFYMEGMGVPLKNFGYYPGALSLTFAAVSIFSPQILKILGQRHCFYFGLISCLISALLIFGSALLQVHKPLIITAILLLFSIGIVIPMNILYTALLELLPNTKGRAAGLELSMLLLWTAFLLELTSYHYHGQFMPLGFLMSITIIVSLIFIQNIIKKKWLILR